MEQAEQNEHLSSITFRIEKDLASKLQIIADEQRRSRSSVIAYIVYQYLASTNGQLVELPKNMEGQAND